MKTHRDMLWYWRSFVLAALVLPSGACVDAVVGEIALCDYEGESYTLNEKFPASDGCNTCTCQIDGDVACTEKACAYEDSGSKVITDSGVGYSSYCMDSMKVYEVGDSFPAGDGCNTCTCTMGGGTSCTKKMCPPALPGSCRYGGKLYATGEGFVSEDGCNMCICGGQDAVKCSDAPCGMSPIADAGTWGGVADGGVGSCTPFSCPMGMGSCNYQGQSYPVGAGFEKGDGCNKCLCVADGLIECSAASCAPPVGCPLGADLYQPMASVTCPDGCNACICDGKNWSTTDKACPALPVAQKCAAEASGLVFPASLVYQTDHALAVAETRCLNGQAAGFDLCFDDPRGAASSEVGLYVVATDTIRPCDGSEERVFSLEELRSAAREATGQMSGKLLLRGGGNQALVYQF